MKLALLLILLAMAIPLAFPASPAHAQIELTEADPPDGARLDAPPDVVHLCFSQTVIIEDNTTFRFGYLMPDGRALGLRIVFQPDGQCVDVYPGLPEDPPSGGYTFQWQVTAVVDDEESSGTLRYQVGEAGSPAPSQSPAPSETPPPGTPPAVDRPPAGGQEGEVASDDGPDILLTALITIAATGGAAVLFTLGYLLRRRIGYDPHRPPDRADEGSGDH